MNSQYNPKNMLVTGGAGFIGSNFIHYLLKINSQVKIINLDLLTYAGSLANLDNLPDARRHEFIQGDICDKNLVEQILRTHQIDTIVHFAAESHVDRSITGPAAFIQTNVLGTFTLLEAARQYWLNEKKWNTEQCRFHHISTDEVYGSLNLSDPAFTEITPYAPNSPYSASKAGSDHLVRAYFHTYGLPISLSNCSNNYGPRQHAEKMIPTVINACKNRQSIPVYGDGSNIRDWLHVTDHCIAIDLILRTGIVGENYNVGGNNELSNLELVHFICDQMNILYPQEKNYRSLITFVRDRAGHDWRYAIDGSKIYRDLAWQPSISFAKGIQPLLTE